MTATNRLRALDPARLVVAPAVALLLVVPGLTGAFSAPAIAGERGFEDDFEHHDFRRWQRSHNWSNNGYWGCAWRNDHVRIEDGMMTLRLSDTATLDRSYTCGEYSTFEKHGFGRYATSMKAARGDGVITGFFIYTGPAFGDPWHETTIEVLGKDTTKVQFTVFVDGVPTSRSMDLGFDAADGLHTYEIEWLEGGIRWFVDGRMMHEVRRSERDLPATPGKLFMHMWNNNGLEDWAGHFAYPGKPVEAQFDWVRFTPAAELTEHRAGLD